MKQQDSYTILGVTKPCVHSTTGQLAICKFPSTTISRSKSFFVSPKSHVNSVGLDWTHPACLLPVVRLWSWRIRQFVGPPKQGLKQVIRLQLGGKFCGKHLSPHWTMLNVVYGSKLAKVPWIILDNAVNLWNKTMEAPSRLQMVIKNWL